MKIIQETVLLYQMEESKAQKIRQICFSMGIKPILVGKDQENAPIGLLAGARDWRNPLMAPGGEAPPMAEEMLLMAGFSEALMDAFLGRLRRMGASVSLKAILTDQNAVWNGSQLQAELKQEREAFLKTLS